LNSAGTVCTVNQLHGIIAIHGSKKFEFERWLAIDFVKTWGANVPLAPFWVFMAQFNGDSPIHFTNNCQVAIICIAELIGKIWGMWDLVIFLSFVWSKVSVRPTE
jgi:hypothetical protein